MMRHDRPLVHSAARLATLLMVSASLFACSSSLPDAWDRPMQTEGPRRAGDELVYLNQTLEQIHRLEPTRSGGSLKLKRTRTPTGNDPTAMKLSPDGKRLFVLNAGDRTLGVYDMTSSELTRQTVQLESAYDRITVSPDGKFVLLTFSKNPDDSCVVCNVNEVGVVDLRDDVPDSAQFVPLGKRATDLVFAEPFQLQGNTQRLVAALSPSLVTFIDLEAVADGESDDALREVQLTVSEAEDVRNPTGATFDIHPADESPAAAHLYVRTQESRDVTQMSLTPSSSSRTFDISVNQLAAGRGPSAMTVLELPGGRKRLMTLDRQRSAFSLIDVQSGESDTFDLPIGSAPTDMLRYELASGDSKQTETRVLAYSTRSEIVAVVRPETIAVSGDNPTLGRSVEAIRLEGQPDSIRLQSKGGRVRAIAALEGGNSAVLKLRSGDNAATPIQSPPLADLFFGADAAWGVFEERDNIARYDLATGHGTPYKLPEPGQRVFLDAEESLLTVQHETTAGTFTVFDLKQLSPDAEQKSGRIFEGVFLDKLLQQRSSTPPNED